LDWNRKRKAPKFPILRKGFTRIGFSFDFWEVGIPLGQTLKKAIFHRDFLGQPFQNPIFGGLTIFLFFQKKGGNKRKGFKFGKR